MNLSRAAMAFVIMLAVMAAGPPLARSAGDLSPNNREKIDLSLWGPLSVRDEAERVSGLGLGFPRDGNAADLYLPYLRGEAAVTKTDWFQEINLAMLDNPRPGDEEKLARAVEEAAPDLAEIEKGSLRRDCRVWGVYYTPGGHGMLFSQDTPEYLNLFRLAALIVARGEELEKAGDHEGAARWYGVALRLGHHLEGEPDLFGYVVGMSIKESAASRMARSLENAGMSEEAGKWREYAEITRGRVEAKNAVFQDIPSWGRDRVERLVLDRDAPYALRLDTLVARHYCLHDEDIIVRCALIGPPFWVWRLGGRFAEQDELSKSFVKALRSQPADLRWAQ